MNSSNIAGKSQVAKSRKDLQDKEIKDLFIPLSVKKVYIDGQSLLTANGKFRKLRTQGNGDLVRDIIYRLAVEYVEAVERVSLTLIYDKTEEKTEVVVCKEGKLEVKTVLATPNYQNSKENMIRWAMELGSDSIKEFAFVSTSKEIKKKVLEVGAEDIISPSNWFEIVKTAIGVKKYEEITLSN